MRIRKTAFALLLVIIFISLEWENKAKAIVAVTNEENIGLIQNTKLLNEESKEGYILLNKHKDKNTKEYLNAYFTYNENSLYVDGIDALPLEFFETREGYLSIGVAQGQIAPGQAQSEQVQPAQDQVGLDQLGLMRVLELGAIKMTLTEDPIYFRMVNESGVYQTSKEELMDSEYIKNLLPQTLEGFKGYLIVQEDKNATMPIQIDLVPFSQNHTECIFGISDSITADNLLYNERLHQYVWSSSKEGAELMITANYYFQITLLNNKLVEGKFTFTKNYRVSK